MLGANPGQVRPVAAWIAATIAGLLGGGLAKAEPGVRGDPG
jgi:hypothetical protein